jgi:hypothetical protein
MTEEKKTPQEQVTDSGLKQPGKAGENNKMIQPLGTT